MGPFRPKEDLSLRLHPFSWNKVSNMLFVESPAGVGFSYSDNAKVDLSTDDDFVAEDNYNVLLSFYERFPEYRSNDLYLSSESYGGHYIPTLAQRVVDRNNDDPSTHMNVKGLLIGNPFTDYYSAFPAAMETFWGHQLISKITYDQYNKLCPSPEVFSVDCATFIRKTYKEMGSINRYALDYPVCSALTGGLLPAVASSQRTRLLQTQLELLEGESGLSGHSKKKKSISFSSFSTNKQVRTGGGPGEDPPIDDVMRPCEEQWLQEYLRLPAVQQATHVRADLAVAPWTWCSDAIDYDRNNFFVSTAPIYNELIDKTEASPLQILIFSGDDDAVCSTLGTQKWIWDLRVQKEETPAEIWKTYVYKGQTAGYLTKWKKSHFTFLTIHGAGHEVPTYKPEIALDMFTKYLQGYFTN
jgi:carboxypeptidase C (cathepsin A)